MAVLIKVIDHTLLVNGPVFKSKGLFASTGILHTQLNIERQSGYQFSKYLLELPINISLVFLAFCN